MNGLWNAFSDQTGTPAPGSPQVSATYPGTPFPTRCFPPASDDELSYDWGFTSSVPLFRVRTDDSGTTLQYGPGTGYPEQYNIAGSKGADACVGNKNAAQTGGPCWPTVPGAGVGAYSPTNPCTNDSTKKCLQETTTNAAQCCVCLGADVKTPMQTSVSNIDLYTEVLDPTTKKYTHPQLYTGTYPIYQTILDTNPNLPDGILACGSTAASQLKVPSNAAPPPIEAPCTPWDVQPMGSKTSTAYCATCRGIYFKHGSLCSKYVAAGSSKDPANWLWHNIFQWQLTTPLSLSRTKISDPEIAAGLQSTSPMFSMEAYDSKSCLMSYAIDCKDFTHGCAVATCGIGDFLSQVPSVGQVYSLFEIMTKLTWSKYPGPGTSTNPTGTMTGFERQTLYDCAFIPTKWLADIKVIFSTPATQPAPITSAGFGDVLEWIKVAPDPTKSS